MEILSKEERIKRRRKIIYRYYIFIFLGYTASLAALYIIKYFGLTEVKYITIHYLSIATLGSSIFFTSLIVFKKNLTTPYAMVVALVQFSTWLCLYTIYVFSLHEMRVIALFFALMPITFLLTTTRLLQSLLIAIGAGVIQLSVAYYAIFGAGQGGSYVKEVILTITFIIPAVYLSYLAGIFANQRSEVKSAKKQTEDALHALWGEMELAKKIQTVLLPKDPKIPGFEIAAYMQSADEVGGDYYDIIEVDGKYWIIIGDVSGHGVPAGLIMMMVQTAIKVTLVINPCIPPDELLTTINSVIFNNIQRLGDIKYMTITVFAVIEKGMLNFAGLHQDIMIYRTNKQKVDVYETRGMWIGLMDDITGMLSNEKLALQKNDVMLLYTDGLTEATDKEEKMFSHEKLEAILENLGNTDPKNIVKNIINELKDYKWIDDITMLIMQKTD